MYLYNLTLQRATGIVCATSGNFVGGKSQEIVVARGKVLDLLRPDDNGKLQTLLSVEVFGAVRSLAQFRLTGSQKDYIVVGSDSGRIVILEYNKEKNVFDKIHQETFGKSGCRRIVPGQYLAVDPKGRAVMIGACEKQKLVYVLNRDTVARLTISSPLEAHKSHTIAYSITGVDCGFDNPIFAAIELDYSEADQDSTGMAASEAQKHLTFYELDLGLNHVSRKWSEPIDNGANMLVTVPGGGDGPSGILVCAENFVIYKNQGHPDIRAVIPRRPDLPSERGVLIVSAATHRQKGMFFFLLQTEYGDIFKVTLEHDNDQVTELKIKYFDTIPVTSAMCVMKLGYLFAASEFGNHGLYQFKAIGEGPDVESSSSNLMETEEGFQPVFFQPRGLKNLMRIDQVESLMPIMDMRVLNLFEEETPQIFTLCGRGPRSSLRILRPGLAVSEMAVSQLPGVPNAVWTVKKNVTDEFDAYIVVSFANATLVLSIGENVEEVNDSGFQDTTPSLAVSLLGDDSLMQVHPNGIRHIREDGRINEWRTPGKKTITKVGSNRLQVVIALNGGELIYFEMDPTGQLMEVEKHEMPNVVSCLDIAPVPEGRQRSRFLAVGSYDNTICILSLDPDDCMQILSLQSVSAAPESLLLLEVKASIGGDDGADHPASVFLNAGLQNGVLFRTEVDMVTGQLSDTRSRFLGLRPPKLFSTIVRGRRAMLCLSSRPWLGYIHQGRFLLTPLSYETLEYAASFSSDQCAEGVVAVSGDALRIFTIERLGETFNETAIPLRYTPRKFILHPKKKHLVIIESDQGAYNAEEREAARRECSEVAGMEENGNANDEQMENGGDGEEKDDPHSDEQYGYPKAESDKWVSCIRVRTELLYETFKNCVKNFESGGKAPKDRPALVKVILDKSSEASEVKMPMVVYVSREKRQSTPHHFKAGALNVLQRVSSVLSNAPYILALDCDTCSNDPSSAKQAMCFHLDPNLSPTLAFVQFPQAFSNIGSYELYWGGLRWVFERLWIGMDGLLGPVLSGTGFFIKRSVLNGARPEAKANKDITHLNETFGSSNLFIATILDQVRNTDTSKDSLINEAHILASCTYEDDTKWGKEVGFLYDSLVEDYFTGFNIHCRGWKSVLCNPPRPAFLGSAPINLCDTMVQNKRWSVGLLQVGFSRFCPLTWGISRTTIAQSMCYACLAFMPLHSIVLCYALVSPLCLLYGISIYPKASSPWFLLFLGTYLSYVGHHVLDVLIGGRTYKQWWQEERCWMMKTVSAFFFGCLNAIMKFIGTAEVNFDLTNKAIDEEQIERYVKGIFDFQGMGLLIIPMTTVSIISLECFVGGVWRMVREGSYEQMLGQVIFTSLILIFSLPLLEGFLVRKDSGRVRSSSSLISLLVSVIVLFWGYIALA